MAVELALTFSGALQYSSYTGTVYSVKVKKSNPMSENTISGIEFTENIVSGKEVGEGKFGFYLLMR